VIGTLEGILREKSPTEILVETGGVGFVVHIPLSTFEQLGEVGSSTRLYTHLVVREDLLQLYGFLSTHERGTFRLLLSVNGIGPKMAQGILSGIGVEDLQTAIAGSDTRALTAVPGVGRKLADRLIVELRDKLGKITPGDRMPGGKPSETARLREEATLALVSLGHNRTTAERAVAGAIKTDPLCARDVQTLIKAAILLAR
jgi:Holliday junction DNA helicase RuvA